MKKYVVMMIAVLCTVSMAEITKAQLVNGGFEDFATGWTPAGSIFFTQLPVSGMPTEGLRFVQVNNGFPFNATLGSPTAAEINTALGITGLRFPGTNATEGSYIYQDITGLAPSSVISFDFKFLTNDAGVFNDFAIVSVRGKDGLNTTAAYFLIADTFSALVPSDIGGYARTTGTQPYSFLSPFSGDIRLGFAILDSLGTDGQSALYMDNVTVSSPDPVPEPATMLLLGAGITGLIGSRIRRKKK